jgi:ribonuclease Z
MVGLTVTFLGTSSAAPTRGRGLPAIALQREGELVILDCGEGIQREILGRGIGLNRETTILITHLHGDHVTGLLGLLQTMSMARRSKPLTIVAPSPLLNWLKLTYETLHFGPTFETNFFPAKSGPITKSHAFIFRGAAAVHSVESYCYLVEEKSRPGIFYPEKARKLGVPEGKLWSRLQRGRSVSVGRKSVRPSDVIGPARPGRRVGYSGDTRPSKRYAKFFAGSDLLIFDSTFAKKDSDKALERKHSTAAEAASVASSAKAKRLVLTHFSARYSSVSSLVREARAIFPNTIAAFDGLKLEVGYPDSIAVNQSTTESSFRDSTVR